MTPPAPLAEQTTLNPVCDAVILEKKGQSNPIQFPYKKWFPDGSSIDTPHVHVTRESHPYLCALNMLQRSTQGGCRYVTTPHVVVSYKFVYESSSIARDAGCNSQFWARHYCALIARRYTHSASWTHFSLEILQRLIYDDDCCLLLYLGVSTYEYRCWCWCCCACRGLS